MQGQAVGIAVLLDELHGFDGVAGVVQVHDEFFVGGGALDDGGAGLGFGFNVDVLQVLEGRILGAGGEGGAVGALPKALS